MLFYHYYSSFKLLLTKRISKSRVRNIVLNIESVTRLSERYSVNFNISTSLLPLYMSKKKHSAFFGPALVSQTTEVTPVQSHKNETSVLVKGILLYYII